MKTEMWIYGVLLVAALAVSLVVAGPVFWAVIAIVLYLAGKLVGAFLRHFIESEPYLRG